MLLRKIRRDLWQRKLRTALTILGLAIAVIGITGVAITNASVIESAERAYGINLSSDIRILTREAEWNESFILDQEGLYDYELTYRAFTTTSINEKTYNVALWGINISRLTDFQSLYGLILDSGTLPDSTQNQLLIDASAAHAFGFEIGETITLPIPSDSDSQVNKINFTISGFARAVREPGYTFTSSISVWLPLNRVQDLMGKPDVYNNLFIKVTEGSISNDVSKNVMTALDENGIFIERVFIYEDSADIRLDVLNLMNILLSITMIIGLLVGGILTTSTIQMAIANERKDISLMKINGATKRHIFFIYISEAVVLGFIGSILGTIISIVFANLFLTSLADPYGLSTLVFIIPETPLLVGFAIPIIVSTTFSLPVIIGTLRISPMYVFQSQDSIKRKSKKNPSFFVLLNYSIKNISRKKIRSILISAMLIIAVGSVVGFRAVGDSAVTTVVELLDSMPGDVQITTSTPENETLMINFLDEFFSENYPTQIDSWTSYWWFSGIRMYPTSNTEPESMQLLGIHPENVLWDAYTKSGSWLSANTTENQVILTTLYISRNPLYDLSIGSEIILGTPLYNESFTIVGYIDDINNQGNMLYTSILTLNRFLKAKNLIDSVIVELNDPTRENEIVNALNSHEFVLAKAWNVVGMTFWKEMNIKQIDFLMLFFDLMGLFGLLVCIIGGINVFSMSVLEREKEIGILKLIGAKPRWVIISFLSEALFIGAIAGIFGVFMARFVIAEILIDIVGRTLVPIHLYFTFDHIVLALGISLLTIFLAALHPSYRASKTSVISALRYE